MSTWFCSSVMSWRRALSKCSNSAFSCLKKSEKKFCEKTRFLFSWTYVENECEDEQNRRTMNLHFGALIGWALDQSATRLRSHTLLSNIRKTIFKPNLYIFIIFRNIDRLIATNTPFKREKIKLLICWKIEKWIYRINWIKQEGRNGVKNRRKIV